MTLIDRCWGVLATGLLTFCLTTANSQALQQGAPAATQTSSEAGPQKADAEGRTRLPMEVRKRVSFREIATAISGGRVTAVVGVAGNPDLYYVGAADGGVFRTNDGGVTWKALFQHESVASIGALAVDPQNPNVVWAGTGEANVRNTVSFGNGIYKSTDGGGHWKRVGLEGTFQISRIEIDPHHPNTVIVAAMGNPWADSAERGVYRTTDGGATWQKVLYIGPSVGIADLAMDPQNPQVLYAAAYRFRRTPWSYLGGGPEDAIYKSFDQGQTWKPSRSMDPSGILDRHWFDLNGGDGIYAIPAPDNPNLIYNSTENGVFMIFDRAAEQVHNIQPYPRDFSGGGVADSPYRFHWNAGFAVSQANPMVLYAGGNVVFKSEDRGRTWKPISPDLTLNDKSKQQSSGGPVVKDNSGAETFNAVIRITPSTKDPNVIWVGTDDGQVQITRDGGASWTNVTVHIPGLPPQGRVESIDLAAENPGDAVITVDRHFNGDFKPYVYRTSDYGVTWQSITGDLPQVYAHVAHRDRRNPHMYYAGLENGLYVTWNDGVQWYLFGLGLPNASVYDLAYHERDNDLVLATHGRGVWILDDLTPFQQFTTEMGFEKPSHHGDTEGTERRTFNLLRVLRASVVKNFGRALPAVMISPCAGREELDEQHARQETSHVRPKGDPA